MKIKVTADNLMSIWGALHRVNGKSQKHTALPGDVFALTAKAEASLASSGLPLRERAGAEVVWHGAGASARAYRYKIMRTHLTLSRGTKGWYLTNVKLIGVYPQQREHFRFTISPTQRDRIVSTALRTFQLRDQIADMAAAPTAATV